MPKSSTCLEGAHFLPLLMMARRTRIRTPTTIALCAIFEKFRDHLIKGRKLNKIRHLSKPGFNLRTIALDEFLRSFKVLPLGKMGLFLGSGCSVQSGIPTGGQLIWEFKRNIYCTKHRIKEDRFKDLDLEKNQTTLQEYFDQIEGFPKRGDPSEYSFYFEQCYPQSQHRRMFLKGKVANKRASLGHLCVGSLIAKNKINRIFTTNFDDLIEKGISQADPALSFVTYSEDNKSFPNPENDTVPWVIKLHGDYLYDPLKNTTEELQKLEDRFHSYIKTFSKDNGMVVCGYSGADDSIMSCLEEALNESSPFPSGFYWVVRKGQSLNKRVKEFLDALSAKHNLVGLLEVDHFDDLAYDLVSACGFSNAQIESGLRENLKLLPYSLNAAGQSEISPLKLNAFRSETLPSQCYQFKSDIKSWKELREVRGEADLICGLFKDNVLCFGKPEDIEKVFKKRMLSELTIRDISSEALLHLNSVELGMIYELINRSLTSEFKLTCKSLRQRIFYSSTHPVSAAELLQRKIFDKALQAKIFEAFSYEIEFVNSRAYLVLNPTIHAELDNLDQSKELQNRILSGRYNPQFNDNFQFWRDRLTGKKEKIGFQAANTLCEFKSTPSYGDAKSSQTTDFFQRVRVIPEPKLHFHHSDPTYSSEHPLKGLEAFGPYESSLSTSNQDLLRLAVICPKAELSKLHTFLNDFNSASTPTTELQYLIRYNSFSNIFKRGLAVPSGVDSSLFSDMTVRSDIQIEAFYSELKRRIDHLSSIRHEFDLLIVYIPDYWKHFREKKDERVYFDLHDSIKIYGAKKHVAIQFLNDKTFRYSDRSKIKWWLSVALFAKAGANPWISDGEESTVYVGLSHSVNKFRQQSMTIGMSQVFDPKGRGTRFLVSPVTRPIMIGKNPFMSKEDARRLIMTLKENYFRMDSNAEIRKLVIHRVSPFINQEIEGILQATEGIDLELLHIQQYPSWRGIKGDRAKGKPAPYPVDRGTVLQLDDTSFLLFSHGNISNANFLNNRNNYFKGARGIPCPLKVTRYAGRESIEKTAAELLRLSKMNWNGAELYKNLPVTIDFSRYLSKYSKQEELLLNVPYDFKYFI
jgi:hypothetical protein